MATISVFNPGTQVFTNLPPSAISGDLALLNILIELRVLNDVLVQFSRGVAVQDNIQNMRIDQANNPT